MTPIDPTKIHVDSNATPAWEQDESFQDMMAERLRQAPWLFLSAALHGALLVLIWALFPPEQPKQPRAVAALDLKEDHNVEEPPPPPPPKTETEEVTDDVVVTETTVTETEEAFDNTESEETSKESAFDSTQWNSSLGLGGGAGGRYGNRGPGGGGRKGGRTYAKEIDAGLRWLAAHQDDDGKWDCDQFMKHDHTDAGLTICDGPGNAVHDVGVTGLALLAFLGDGNTMRSGPYRAHVKKGVNWLRRQQQDNGLFGTAASHDFVYDHAIAAYAMCEAYGLSNYRLLKEPAQQGINYLEAHRNPYSVWRYQPRDGDNDISVTGWAIMAYESGEFFGLQINKSALQMAESFLDQVADASGRHGYTKPGQDSSRKPGEHGAKFPIDKTEALTAVGLFCRYFMGQKPKERPIMAKAADLIRAKPPVWDEQAGTIDHYYWYYATYALFQHGGKHWEQWRQKIEKVIIKHQHDDPTQQNLTGSWDPVGAWGEDGGRVYSTAILTLTLQATFRYTRLLH